jgi:hypothetical protein
MARDMMWKSISSFDWKGTLLQEIQAKSDEASDPEMASPASHRRFRRSWWS